MSDASATVDGSVDAVGTRRRLDADERRSQLVAAGLELVKTVPLDDVSAPAVAARARVSKALVFHYFPTQRDLQAAVARAAADELLTMFVATDVDASHEERLEAGLRAFVGYLEQQPMTYATIARGAGRDEQLAAVFEDTRSAVVDIISDALGYETPTPAMRLVLRGWIAMVEEMTLEWLTSGVVEREALITFLRDAAFGVLVWARTCN